MCERDAKSAHIHSSDPFGVVRSVALEGKVEGVGKAGLSMECE